MLNRRSSEPSVFTSFLFHLEIFIIKLCEVTFRGEILRHRGFQVWNPCDPFHFLSSTPCTRISFACRASASRNGIAVPLQGIITTIGQSTSRLVSACTSANEAISMHCIAQISRRGDRYRATRFRCSQMAQSLRRQPKRCRFWPLSAYVLGCQDCASSSQSQDFEEIAASSGPI